MTDTKPMDQGQPFDLERSWRAQGTLKDYIEGKYVDRKAAEVGLKLDQDKPRFGLVPAKALTEVTKVLTYGARKYSAENWRHVDMARYFDASQRHLWAYKGGQELDPESGMNHLAHAICSLMFMLQMDLEKA